MSYLDELFTRFGTDKGIWGYTPAYEKHLAPFREQASHVLEIGICGFRDIPNNVVGASLFAWRDYFPNAVINGVDNDGRFIFNDQDRIRTAQADAYNWVELANVLRRWGPPQYDFICDDAVHDPIPQIYLFRWLWPYVKINGVYAIEEACPYKVPGGRLEMLGDLIHAMFNDACITEYQTHKDERLLIVEKSA